MSAPPYLQLPDRPAVLAVISDAMDRSGRRWAWQGPADARSRWVSETGLKDLDIWYDGDSDTDGDADGDAESDGDSDADGDADGPDDHPRAPVVTLRQRLRCAIVAHARNPGRLRHRSLVVETGSGTGSGTGIAIVDITDGDLRVGPILLVPVDEIDVDPVGHRLTGAAAVADLLVRPVLRGRWPEPARLAEARAAWATTSTADRRLLSDRLTGQLGPALVGALAAALRGAQPAPSVPRRARARLVARSLAPANAAATWAARRTVLPAGRAAGPLGPRVRGVVVALVGTDGAGKSTVADGLAARLEPYRLGTASAYFGMAHGNLPGVRLARRALGVSSRPSGEPTPQRPAGPGVAARLDHPFLRRVAAWYYAFEYGWRYLRTVAPYRWRRRVVIVDRWVYDLHESPWPGSFAARVAERLVPDPDLVVLPDAPIELIHARKPERPLAEQAAQQERYRNLLARRPARYAEVVVDTSGRHADALGELVTAVVEVAHATRPRRGRR